MLRYHHTNQHGVIEVLCLLYDLPQKETDIFSYCPQIRCGQELEDMLALTIGKNNLVH